MFYNARCKRETQELSTRLIVITVIFFIVIIIVHFFPYFKEMEKSWGLSSSGSILLSTV